MLAIIMRDITFIKYKIVNFFSWLCLVLMVLNINKEYCMNNFAEEILNQYIELTDIEAIAIGGSTTAKTSDKFQI